MSSRCWVSLQSIHWQVQVTMCLLILAGYVTRLLSGKQKEGLKSLTDLSWGFCG